MIPLFNLFKFVYGCLRYALNWHGVDCPSSANVESKVILITGANRGIGKATAIELARRGAKKVILACRDMTSAESTCEEIKLLTGNPNIVAMELDFSSFASIQSFADRFTANHDQLNIFINNAGLSNGLRKRKLTSDGLEEHWQVNHVGPFHLIRRLLPLLEASASWQTMSRIILVSSSAHRYLFRLDLDNLNSDSFYSPGICYCKSKLANEAIATHLASTLMEKHITINTLCPGGVYTDLFARYPTIKAYPNLLGSFLKATLRTPEKGAQTVVYCAVEPSLDNVTGQHFLDCRPAEASSMARDVSLAEKIHHKTEQFVQKILTRLDTQPIKFIPR